MFALSHINGNRIVAGGSKKIANYILAFYIVGIGFYRDYCFHAAIETQPVLAEIVENPIFLYVSYALIAVGQTFVLTSFYKLGFLGTFLGKKNALSLLHLKPLNLKLITLGS